MNHEDVEVIIERLNIENQNLLINTNNYKQDSENHLDYTEEVYKTSLRKWRYLIDYPVIFEYKFLKHEISIFLETHEISVLQQRLPKTYTEEYINIISRMKSEIQDIPESGIFFKFDTFSTKDGICEYPIKNIEQLITQIATSERKRM